MMEKQGITEELKVRDQMEWVRVVNGIRSRAEEIVLKEFKVMESSFGSFSLIIENLKMIKCKVEVKLYER